MEKYRLVQEHKTDEDRAAVAREQQQHQSTPIQPPPPPSSAASAAAAAGKRDDDETANDSKLEGHPEVRITQQGKPRNYISYAMSLFVRTTMYI